MVNLFSFVYSHNSEIVCIIKLTVASHLVRLKSDFYFGFLCCLNFLFAISTFIFMSIKVNVFPFGGKNSPYENTQLGFLISHYSYMSYLTVKKFFCCISFTMTADLRRSLSELNHFVNYSNTDQDSVPGQEYSGSSDFLPYPNKDFYMGYCLNTDTQRCQMYH